MSHNYITYVVLNASQIFVLFMQSNLDSTEATSNAADGDIIQYREKSLLTVSGPDNLRLSRPVSDYLQIKSGPVLI